MNLVFWIIIGLAAIFLWFCLSFLFVPLGKSIHRLYQDAMDEINNKDTSNED